MKNRLPFVGLVILLSSLVSCAKPNIETTINSAPKEKISKSVLQMHTPEELVDPLPFGGRSEFLIGNHDILSEKVFWETTLKELMDNDPAGPLRTYDIKKTGFHGEDYYFIYDFKEITYIFNSISPELPSDSHPTHVILTNYKYKLKKRDIAVGDTIEKLREAYQGIEIDEDSIYTDARVEHYLVASQYQAYDTMMGILPNDLEKIIDRDEERPNIGLKFLIDENNRIIAIATTQGGLDY